MQYAKWGVVVLAGFLSVRSPAQGQPQSSAAAQQPAPDPAKPVPQISPEARFDYQGEITFIGQDLFPFRSSYEGRNSLPSKGLATLSHTYTLYLGMRLTKNVEVYVNPELALGNGPGDGFGLAGYSNGDLIGQPVTRPEPYLARAFVRWRIPLRQRGSEPLKSDKVGRAPNLIAGTIPSRRVVVTVGKLPASDLFDYNSYANNPRTQFINNAFGNNLAYDYAEDERGYDFGASAALVEPNWAFRVGTFAMATLPGGARLAYGAESRGDQVELELSPQILRTPKPPSVIRFTAFRNTGPMGSYQDALNAAPPGTAPDLGSVRKSGITRSGFGLNFEQGLADGGDTGVFARLGWADGNIESYNFAECDQFASAGIQVSGAHWRRKGDRAALALAKSDIDGSHRRYLSAGGRGLTLGDGGLRYGSEGVFEAYYLYQMDKRTALTLDYQHLINPGYNQDRGPVSVLSARMHWTF